MSYEFSSKAGCQEYFGKAHDMVRKSVKAFVDKEILPFIDDWEEAGEFPRELYQKAPIDPRQPALVDNPIVPDTDLWMMLAAGVVIICPVIYFYNDLLAMSYDEEFAQIRGVRVKFLYFLLIGLLAVSIVMIIQVVGLILVIALLTIPPFIAEKHANSLFKMMVFSSLLSVFFTLTGLWLSYAFNLTSGASIILVASTGFLIALAFERRTARRPDRGAAALKDPTT